MVCLGMLNRVPLADTNGRWAGHDALQTCPLPSFIFFACKLMPHLLNMFIGEFTIFSDECLGSSNDEGCSEVR